MGLDVVGYSKIVRWQDGDDPSSQILVENEPLYRKRLDTFDAGAYRSIGTRLWEFSAGYGTAAAWFNALSMLVLGVPAEEVRKQPAHFDGQPFLELIDFPTEGAIGPRTCARILQAFEAHHDAVTRVFRTVDARNEAKLQELWRDYQQDPTGRRVEGLHPTERFRRLVADVSENVGFINAEKLYCGLEETFRLASREGVVLFH